MSFYNILNSTVQNFIAAVAAECKIPVKTLEDIWNRGGSGSSSAASVSSLPASSVNMDDISPVRLTACSKVELAALCKHHGVKCTGKKEELIERLSAKANPASASASRKTAVPETKKPTPAPVRPDVKSMPSVLQKVMADTEPCMIRRNARGNYEHSASGLVFDTKTSTAIGKQQDDGSVSDLSEDDIDTCKKYKFKYRTPTNLENISNAKTSLKKELPDIKEEDANIGKIQPDVVASDKKITIDVDDIEEDEEDEEVEIPDD